MSDQWQQYITLFATSSETVELLNRHAGWFFGTVQRSLINGVMLGISRLTDPPGTGDKTNLVISELLLDPHLEHKPELMAELTSRITAVREMALPVRSHRSKYIAHLDHAVALMANRDLLPLVTQKLVTDLLAELGAIFQLHGLRLYNTDYDLALAPLGSVDRLLRSLYWADLWRNRDLAERRRQSGLPPIDDGAS